MSNRLSRKGSTKFSFVFMIHLGYPFYIHIPLLFMYSYHFHPYFILSPELRLRRRLHSRTDHTTWMTDLYDHFSCFTTGRDIYRGIGRKNAAFSVPVAHGILFGVALVISCVVVRAPVGKAFCKHIASTCHRRQERFVWTGMYAYWKHTKTQWASRLCKSFSS